MKGGNGPYSVQIKVCGLTDPADGVSCAEAGARWIGLNFHPASPRAIAPERGAEIARALSDYASSRLPAPIRSGAIGPETDLDAVRRGLRGIPVGLFVDRPFDEVAGTILGCGIDLIQLHGDEPPEYLLACARFKPPLKVVKAFRISDVPSINRMAAWLDKAKRLGVPPFAILVDAHVPGQPGGTGRSIADDLLDQIPHHPRLILAGGLTPENVANRVARHRPWMVDVASGVESTPGVKDPEKVARFVAEANRGAGRATKAAT